MNILIGYLCIGVIFTVGMILSGIKQKTAYTPTEIILMIVGYPIVVFGVVCDVIRALGDRKRAQRAALNEIKKILARKEREDGPRTP